MSADAAPAPLSKVDSAVQGLSSSPPKDAKRRASSTAAGVYNINDLGISLQVVTVINLRSHRFNSINFKADTYREIEKEGKELTIAKETQKLNWFVGTRGLKCLILFHWVIESQPYVLLSSMASTLTIISAQAYQQVTSITGGAGEVCPQEDAH